MTRLHSPAGSTNDRVPMTSWARGDNGRRTRNKLDLATMIRSLAGVRPPAWRRQVLGQRSLRQRRVQRRFDVAVDLLRLLVHRIVDIEFVRDLRRAIQRSQPI